MGQSECRITGEDAARIVDSVADALERREPDYDPATKWASDDWRVGRTSRHTGRIYEEAASMLPDDVVEAAERHWNEGS